MERFDIEANAFACQCELVDIWNIVHFFSYAYIQELPNYLMQVILYMEFDIVFKHLWRQNINGKSYISLIFENMNDIGDLSIKRLQRVLSERLYLLTEYLSLTDVLKDKCWELIKNVIMNGFIEDSLGINFSFK